MVSSYGDEMFRRTLSELREVLDGARVDAGDHLDRITDSVERAIELVSLTLCCVMILAVSAVVVSVVRSDGR